MTLAFSAIPEPRPESRLGHLGDWLGVENARRTVDRVRRYGEQCGPLARVSLGPKRILVVSAPELVSEVLGREQSNHKGLVYGLTRVVLDNVLLLNGPVWLEQRRRYAEALQGADWASATARPLEAWLDRLGGLAPGTRIELDRLIPGLVADLLGHLLGSADFPERLEPHRRRIQHELAAVGIDIQCRPWAYLSARRFLDLRRSVRSLKEFFGDLVRQRLASGVGRADGAAPADVLDACLVQGRPPTEVAEMLCNLFFTGHDVVSTALSFCLYALGSAPTEQEALGPGGDPATLDRVLLESLRLYPGYPLFAREAVGPLELAGHEIPRGTMLIVAPAAIHRLTRYWDDPGRFQPERWRAHTARSGSAASAFAFNGTTAYLPFGGGRRACLAARLVLPLLRTLVAGIAGRIRLEAEIGHVPRLAYWGSTYAENGLPVRVFPRHPPAHPPGPARVVH